LPATFPRTAAGFLAAGFFGVTGLAAAVRLAGMAGLVDNRGVNIARVARPG
jgi:hypothetical protein